MEPKLGRDVNVESELRRAIGALRRFAWRKLLLWVLAIPFVASNLLFVALYLIVQLHWLPTVWPHRVTKILFEYVFTASIVTAILYVPGIILLWHKELKPGVTDNLVDPLKRVARLFATPALYVLCILWSWCWLVGGRFHDVGIAIAVLFGGHQIWLFVYFGVRAFRKARLAKCSGTTPEVEHVDTSNRNISI